MRKGTLLFLAVAAAFAGSILSTEVQGQRGQQPVADTRRARQESSSLRPVPNVTG